MDRFTSDFVSRQSDEWLEDYTNNYYEASDSKRAKLEYNFKMAQAELLKRYQYEEYALYNAESKAEYGQDWYRLDGAYDVEDY